MSSGSCQGTTGSSLSFQGSNLTVPGLLHVCLGEEAILAALNQGSLPVAPKPDSLRAALPGVGQGRPTSGQAPYLTWFLLARTQRALLSLGVAATAAGP